MKKVTNDIIDARLLSKKRNIVRCENSDGTHKSIIWRCLICEHQWNNNPNNILDSHQGCPKCAGQVPRTDQEIDDILKSTKRQIQRLEPTKGDCKHINWLCVKCQHVWKATPIKIIKALTGCPNCAGRPNITNKEIDRRLIRCKKPIKRIGDYVNTNTPMKWRCLTDKSHAWNAAPKTVTSNNPNLSTGCPHCRKGIFGSHNAVINGISFRSTREANSYKILLQYFTNEQIQNQKRYNGRTKHTCDFFISPKGWWIEIGNIKTASYLTTLQQKKNWVEDINEKWYHFNSELELKQFLESYFDNT